MWIYFDLQTIATTRVFDTPIRQGDIGDELFVRFEGYNSFVGKFVTLQIEYPNGLLSPEVYMELGFSKLFTLPTQGDFTNGVTYLGVRYIFTDPIWFQQFGLHKITVRVYTGSGGQPSAIETSGLFSFNVEKSVFNPEAPITIAQYQYLLSLINATQLNIDNVIVIVDVLPNLNDLGPNGFLYDKRWFVVRGVSPVQLGTLFYIDGNQAVQVELGVNTLQIQGQAGNEGQLKWNADKGSIELILQSGVTTFLNKATMFYCKANEVINIGDVCEFVNYQGDHIIIRRARQSSINANPSLVMGLASNAMGINGFGYVTAFGEIFNIPTRGLSQGSFIYFDSGIANFGEWTSTPPTAPNAKVLCGVVTVASANPSSTNGKVLVRLGYEPRLGELQDVNISGVTAGQVIARNVTNTLWENTTLVPGDIGAQPAGSYATLDGNGKVPAGQLPSYVDDVLEFANLASFPVTGETGKIYIAINTPPTTKSRTYRWSGSVYVEINPQEIQTALETPFTPYGPIGSSDVQNAIQELFNESSFIAATEYATDLVEIEFGQNIFSGYALTVHNHDASAITSGVLSQDRLPDLSQQLFDNPTGTIVNTSTGAVNINVGVTPSDAFIYRITWGLPGVGRMVQLLTLGSATTGIDPKLFTNFFNTSPNFIKFYSAAVAAGGFFGTEISFGVGKEVDIINDTITDFEYRVYRIERIAINKI